MIQNQPWRKINDLEIITKKLNNIKKLKYVTILVEGGTFKTKNIKNGN
jgi:hypothetical protein